MIQQAIEIVCVCSMYVRVCVCVKYVCVCMCLDRLRVLESGL